MPGQTDPAPWEREEDPAIVDDAADLPPEPDPNRDDLAALAAAAAAARAERALAEANEAVFAETVIEGEIVTDADPPGFVPNETPGGELVSQGTVWTIDHRDPETVRHVASLVRRRAVEVVDGRYAKLKAERESLCGDRPPNVSDVSDELRDLVDTHDALDAIGKAVHAARDHAAAILVDVVEDTGRRSARTGDGHGQDLTVTLDTPKDTVADLDKIASVLRGALALAWDLEDDAAGTERRNRSPRDAYLQGVEEGIAKLREVLVSKPGVRTTALDALTRELAAREPGGKVLASELSRAYSRVPKPDAPTRAIVKHVEPAKVRGSA